MTACNLKSCERWDDQMNGNNLEQLIVIGWTCTISLADVPHSEVNRGVGGTQPQYSILQAYAY